PRKPRDQRTRVLRQRELLERVLGATARLSAVETAEFQVGVDHLLHVEEVERSRFLRHARDLRADGPLLGSDIVSEDEDRTARGRELGRRDPDEGGFTGAVAPDQPVDPSGRDLEGEVLEGERPGTGLRVGLPEVNGGNRGRHGRRASTGPVLNRAERPERRTRFPIREPSRWRTEGGPARGCLGLVVVRGIVDPGRGWCGGTGTGGGRRRRGSPSRIPPTGSEHDEQEQNERENDQDREQSELQNLE